MYYNNNDRENTDSNSCSDQMSFILSGEEIGENSLRHHRFRFLLATLACSCDIINVWRYPMIVHKHGGIIFVAVFLVYLTIGWPIYSLELTLGQISSEKAYRGHCLHNFTPLLKGLDISAAIYIIILLLYQISVITWVLLYCFNSIQDVVPWSECGNGTHRTECVLTNETRLINIECKDRNMTCDGNAKELIPLVTSSRYFENYIADPSSDVSDFGAFSGPVFGCLVFAWFIVFLNTIKGKLTVKGRAAAPTIAILLLLTALFSFSFNNDGAKSGIAQYLQFIGKSLSDPLLWNDALIQVVLTLNIGGGTATYFSRIAKHHHHLFIESAGTVVIDMIVCFYYGMIVYSWLGVMARAAHYPVSKILPKDQGFAFVVLSSAIATLPVPQLWSVCLFLLVAVTSLKRVERHLVTLVFNLRQIVNIRFFRKRRRLFILSLCCVMCFIGVIFTFGIRYHLVFVLDCWVIGYACLLLSVLEVAAVCWLYGSNSLFADMRGIITREGERKFWKIVWTIVTPCASIALLVFTCTNTHPPTSGEFHYEHAAQTLGWSLIALILSPCFLYLSSIIFTVLYTSMTENPSQQNMSNISTVEGTSRQSIHSYIYEQCTHQPQTDSALTYHVLLVTSEEKSSLPGIPCGFLLSPAKQKIIAKPQAKLPTRPEITVTCPDPMPEDDISIRHLYASSSNTSLRIPYYQTLEMIEGARENDTSNRRLQRRYSSDTDLISMARERGNINEAFLAS